MYKKEVEVVVGDQHAGDDTGVQLDVDITHRVIGSVAVHSGDKNKAVSSSRIERGIEPGKGGKASFLPVQKLLRSPDIGIILESAIVDSDSVDVRAAWIEYHELVDVLVDGGGAQIGIDGGLGGEGGMNRRRCARTWKAEGIDNRGGIAAKGFQGQHLL